MKIKYLLALVSATLLIAGCDRQARHHYRPLIAEKEEVKIYKVHHTNNIVTNATSKVVVSNSSTSANDWLYWYIIFDRNTRSYYYSASPDLMTTYSSLTWTESKTAPTIAEAEEEVEPVETVEVESSQLGEATTEISSDYSSIPEDNSLDSMEGVPEAPSEAAPAESAPSESSSDSSSSSSDSGSSSGGDSGGGDSGGGGGD